jgi:hypothetical protein
VTRLLSLVLVVLMLLSAPAAWGASAAGASAAGASAAVTQRYLCDGDALEATLHNGAVDASEIPNSEGGTVPGAFIVLQWRGVNLQLPRTNNAGIPSYNDSRWWWQAVDPDRPNFREHRGSFKTYACSR